MRIQHWLLASAIALFAAPAFAGVSLIEPRAGDRLQGGADARLTWTADALPADVEEWEAFLSVDGGGYYAVRVTPHLDAGIRSVTWRVPNVATTRARLMLRIGDEEHERIIELPQTFTIEPTAARIELVSVESEPGEAATPDGEPTVEWVSSDFVTHRRADPSASNEPRLVSSPVCEVCMTETPATRIAERVAHSETPACTEPCQSHTTIVLRPLLLLTTRLNI